MSDERLSSADAANAGEITAEAFLDLLERKDIVAPGVLTALRKQVVESKGKIPARRTGFPPTFNGRVCRINAF